MDNNTNNSRHQILLNLRRADYRRAMRQSRYKTWLEHGEGQRMCYVYLPQYPKELYEVSDWRPIEIGDPKLREGTMLKGQTETAHAG